MPALIELRDAHRSYRLGRRSVEALRGIDLDVHEGQFLAVVGPSGSGKTTLLNMLSLIDVPAPGELRFGGELVNAMSDDQLTEFRSRHVSIVFQTFNLVPVLSALENVALALQIRGVPGGQSEREARSMLERVGLGEQSDQRPDEMSGGQRQRVAIARALVTRPQIVVADEPTAALDGRTAKQIVELMRELNVESKTTFIFSTHDHRLLGYVGNRLELDDGRIRSLSPSEAA